MAKLERKQKDLFAQITFYVEKSSGLILNKKSSNEYLIRQSTDGKTLPLCVDQLDEVIPRLDGEGNHFLQVNFSTGKKILITQNLIGFRPVPIAQLGSDSEKLPRVVTTKDLVSIYEVIEETLYDHEEDLYEVHLLKEIYKAVLAGAEAVGFDLSNEKQWLTCLKSTRGIASA